MLPNMDEYVMVVVVVVGGREGEGERTIWDAEEGSICCGKRKDFRNLPATAEGRIDWKEDMQSDQDADKQVEHQAQAKCC